MSEELRNEVLSLIKQLGAVVSRIHSEAGDPTVNDDVDLGYKAGDLWINTADAGVFICISAGDGAADWDELAKA
jgi:hypothetical protein